MHGKLNQVGTATRTFVKASNPEDELFIVNFNERVTLGLPAETPFTNSTDKLEAAILRDPTTGQTALYDAITAALEKLRSGSRDRKALVIISDGSDNASRHTLKEVLTRIAQSNVVLYTVGIFGPTDPDRNPKVLRQLAQASGGEAFFPAELNDITAVCQQIARDIRSQYTIGYVSTSDAKQGTYRRVRLTAEVPGRGKLAVRTRTGYLKTPTVSPR
jgi:VWFA-related protein